MFNSKWECTRNDISFLVNIIMYLINPPNTCRFILTFDGFLAETFQFVHDQYSNEQLSK
jgi:hypothetical protein